MTVKFGNLSNMKTLNLRTKLLVQFVLIGILPVAALGVMTFNQASQSIETAVFDKLHSVKEMKKSAVESTRAMVQKRVIILQSPVLAAPHMALNHNCNLKTDCSSSRTVSTLLHSFASA